MSPADTERFVTETSGCPDNVYFKGLSIKMIPRHCDCVSMYEFVPACASELVMQAMVCTCMCSSPVVYF